jgi:nucleoside 2-deoxyribosyltransferase
VYDIHTTYGDFLCRVASRLLLSLVFLCLIISPGRAGQPRLYLASPLGFTESGKTFKDTVLKPALSQLGFEVVDPWTLADPKKFDAISALPVGERKTAWQKLDRELGEQNRLQIDQSDIILAILDGSDVDSGTAAEVGYAFGQKKKIFGYRSDFRLASDNEGALVNLQVEYFVSASGGEIFSQVAQLRDLKAAQPNGSLAQANSPKPPDNAKSASRSILDAFTIFPFAIILALSLSEAFKMVVSEKPTTNEYINWGKLYALAAFLLLILPFYQGMNKYLLITYGDLNEGARPHSIFLIIDGLAFMLESALFFAMSRTLGLEHWARFYVVVFILLAVDSLWGFSVRLHSNAASVRVIEHWTMLNLVTIVLLALLIEFGRSFPRPHLLASLGLVGMLARTILDYWISWDFYFPS